MKAAPLRPVRSEFCANYAADTTEAEKFMRRQIYTATARQIVGTRELGGVDHLRRISQEPRSCE